VQGLTLNLDEYLSNLAAINTIPQDRILVAQVKLQLIIIRIHHYIRKARNAKIPLPYIAALQARTDVSAGVDGKYSECQP
jgi:hypothetical protein